MSRTPTRDGHPDALGAVRDELEDPEASGPIPSAALASHAAKSPADARALTDRAIWDLAWPTILSQILANLVSLIDIIMIGRLGTEALAATGYATQYLWLAQSILFAIGAACVALMAQAIGAGRPERARAALAASLLLALVSGGVLTGCILAFPRPLLAILDAPPGVIEIAIPYFRLTLGSAMLFSGSAILESGFRAARDARTPMWIASGVALLKLILNALLIFGLFGLPRLELIGAGIATLLSQALGVVVFVAMSRRGGHVAVLRLRASDFRSAGGVIGETTRIAAPAVAERVVLNAAIMAYFAVLGQYGPVAIAAYTVGVRVLAFSWIPPVGFSVAGSTLVGQALGAGDEAGAERAGWRSTGFALAVSVVLGAVFALAREPLGGLFTDDAAVVAAMGPFILLLALSQPLMGVHFALGGALRGAGDTVTPLLAAGLGNWGFRVPVAYVAARVLQADVLWAWVALLLDHAARAVWMLWAWRRGAWRARARVPESAVAPARSG